MSKTRLTERQQKFSGSFLANSFLDYYRDRGHTVVESSPLVPEDPTLLFTAAGMVPFKAYYNDPKSAPYATAASVQKCLRAGGKQSDLENVGRTLRHHTFFEMLGNFSFGDYFKKEAIETAWDLSTNVWGLDKERIWVSVYHDDDEAWGLWTKHIGLPEARMVRLGKADNFWGPVGDTGVCGPSSEMYFDTMRDLGETRDSKPGDDDERFIEYWNLVFPQFFYTDRGEFDPLPKPGIDTGMGLERVAFLLQEVEDNFHTDLFLPIRDAIISALPATEPSARFELAINAASDHVRALVFALTEPGSKRIIPSNEGRGYVLRRLLRRALTKLHPFGVKQPVLVHAIDAVVTTMGGRYPQLAQGKAFARQVIGAEEEHFLSTIEQGWNRLQELIERSAKRKDRTIPGRDAFVLYDTFGFPLELTVELAGDAGLSVDTPGYDAAMDDQKERSRKGAQFAGHAVSEDDVRAPFVKVHEPTPETDFIGYEDLETDATVEQFRPVGSDAVELTTDRTVFYPVGGGQVGDQGKGTIAGEGVPIIDTFREDGKIVHVARQDPAALEKLVEASDRVHLAVDHDRRFHTMRNHTGTHLLHKALREVLGDHVAQAGSLVAPDRLRFDFHHFQPMTDDEVASVETIVNDAVLADMAVTYETMPYKEAIATGAMALFGEKYGDDVRVVSIGDFSRELCGGTHLHRTGEVGAFVVTHETSVAAGIRRVEAFSGTGALAYFREAVADRAALAASLKVAPGELVGRVRTLQEELDAVRRDVAKQESARAAEELRGALSGAEQVGDIKLVAQKLTSGDMAGLRSAGDLIRDKMDLGVGMLYLASGKKPTLLIVVSDRMIAEKAMRAGDLARSIGEKFSLRGGGKPHMAQLGVGADIDFDAIVSFVREKLAEAP